MQKVALAFAAAALTLSAGSALAQKKQVVIIVKGLDNPFFEAMHQGCEKWNRENASSPYQCFYTGPASTSDEAGEAQIVSDILGKSDTAAVAISPSNAPMIANTIKSANPKIPVMTIDADLKTVCIIEGNAAADNILRRASGTRDALSGKKGLDRLNGEGGWTEIAGCPVFTNDDGPKGVQAMSDILAANPKLDAFVLEGGWPLFGAPQPYRQLTDQVKARLADKSLVITGADTIGDEVAIAKEGRVNALVGQRPFGMGYKAPTVMIDLIEGKKVGDPVFTGLDECTKETADTCIQR